MLSQEDDDVYIENNETDEETEDDTDESKSIDYDDRSIADDDKHATVEYCFGDIDDIDESDSETPCAPSSSKRSTRIIRQSFDTGFTIDNIPNFDNLDEEEKEYLPFNYIVSPALEWAFIQEACASGFRSVSNLSRVSNKTIRLIADIAQYTLQTDKAVLPQLNMAFITYAKQRDMMNIG